MPIQEQLDRSFDRAYAEQRRRAQDRPFDGAQDRMVQLDPRSDEFKRLLLKIAEASDHPNDVAIARILRRELKEESGDSNGS
jgi:hypothetical protein